jgi:hypothetical protein
MQNPSKSTDEVSIEMPNGRAEVQPSPLGETRLALWAHANLLLCGNDGQIETVLDALRPDLVEPVVSWRPGVHLRLPPVGMSGTLILLDVASLAPDDQRRIFDWLSDTRGRIQVISTTRTSLMPLVEAGAFFDTLYYRLNMVRVDVTV